MAGTRDTVFAFFAYTHTRLRVRVCTRVFHLLPDIIKYSAPVRIQNGICVRFLFFFTLKEHIGTCNTHTHRPPLEYVFLKGVETSLFFSLPLSVFLCTARCAYTCVVRTRTCAVKHFCRRCSIGDGVYNPRASDRERKNERKKQAEENRERERESRRSERPLRLLFTSAYNAISFYFAPLPTPFARTRHCHPPRRRYRSCAYNVGAAGCVCDVREEKELLAFSDVSSLSLSHTPFLPPLLSLLIDFDTH